MIERLWNALAWAKTSSQFIEPLTLSKPNWLAIWPDSNWKIGDRLAARQIRLPAAAGFAVETLWFWTRFLDAQLRRGIPVLLVLPLDESWVDVTCGEPTPRDLYSLRATRQIVEIASEADEIPGEVPQRQQRSRSGDPE